MQSRGARTGEALCWYCPSGLQQSAPFAPVMHTRLGCTVYVGVIHSATKAQNAGSGVPLGGSERRRATALSVAPDPPSKFWVTAALGSSSRACQIWDMASRTCRAQPRTHARSAGSRSAGTRHGAEHGKRASSPQALCSEAGGDSMPAREPTAGGLPHALLPEFSHGSVARRPLRRGRPGSTAQAGLAFPLGSYR